MVICFPIDGHIVDGGKTLVEVNCEGDWGESTSDGDDYKKLCKSLKLYEWRTAT